MAKQPYRAINDSRYSDPTFVIGKLKELEPQLNLQWDIYYSCSPARLEEEMATVGKQVLEITKDKSLSTILEKFLTYTIMMSRKKSRT